VVLVRGSRASARRDDRGAVAVLVAVLALVLFGMAAIVVDLGLARDTRRQAQNTADSAALAAGNALYLNGVVDTAAAISAAKSYAARNFGTTNADWATCSDVGRPAGFQLVPGQTPCISFAGSPAPTEVRVVVPRRPVSAQLGRVFGVAQVDVSAAAQAAVAPGGRATCGLCVIGTGTHDVQNGDITVTGTNAHFNGVVDANPQFELTVVGGQTYLQGDKPGKGTMTPEPYTRQPEMLDPLAFLTLPPDTTGLQPKTVSACAANGGPGIYRSLGLSGTCTLKPGLYVVTGSNHESGKTSVTAAGVTLYFTCQDASSSTPKVRPCNDGEKGGNLLFTGQATLDINAPATGTLAGLAVVADRKNAATFGWRGNGAAGSSGTIYLKSGTLDYRGNGAGEAMDSLVVVKSLEFSGKPSGFNLVYNDERNVSLPPGALHLTR
jgi:hypothetical protein